MHKIMVLIPAVVSEPFFVALVLIFKKLHLLLHSKMEVQGEKCVENY